jgi:putative membrane protein
MPSDHRLHPSSILFALGGSLRAFALPALFLLVTSGRSSPERAGGGASGPARWMNRWIPGDFEIANWQFWMLLFLIPSIVVALARYFSFRLRYEGRELVIRSGIIFRNERHVPYERIQNLDAVRNIVHRLLGVAEVRVETGGGQAPEATISVLHETVFEEMRRRIFEGRQRANATVVDQPHATPAAAPVVDARTLLHLPLRELLLNGLLDNRGLIAVAAAYGVLWEAGLLRVVRGRLAGEWFRPRLLRDTLQSLAAGNLPSLRSVALLFLGIGGLLVVVRVFSMAWAVLRLHEFKLARVGDDLRTEYGLLTRVTATIPLKRVQTLTIHEAPLQRLARRVSVRVETAGGHGRDPGEGLKQPREQLAPIIRQSAVPALLREVLPVVDLSALEWQPLHPRAFRRAIKPAMLIAIITAVPFVVGFGWNGLTVLWFTLPWLGLASWAHVRHTQWAVTDEVIALRSGWLWRYMTVAPIAKIQTVSVVESPFDRRAAMSGLRVDTAGGRLHQIRIPYLARETSRTLYDRLAAQIGQTSFRW